MPDINRNIWAVDPYVYKATASGLEVYDLASESLISFTFFGGGINSVWANDSYVYVATTSSGIYRSSVSGTLAFSTYKSYPDITNDYIIYLHGSGDYLCATTISGVDRYKFSTAGREFVEVVEPYKCFQTSTGDYYYVVNSIGSTALNAVYNSGGGYEYNSSQELMTGFTHINDLFITEGTSIYDNDNTLFLATTSGALLIEERRGNESDSRVRIYRLES